MKEDLLRTKKIICLIILIVKQKSYGVDVLHQPVWHPIFSYSVG